MLCVLSHSRMLVFMNLLLSFEPGRVEIGPNELEDIPGLLWQAEGIISTLPDEFGLLMLLLGYFSRLKVSSISNILSDKSK